MNLLIKPVGISLRLFFVLSLCSLSTSQAASAANLNTIKSQVAGSELANLDLSAGTYASCEDLQREVSQQLQAKKLSDVAEQKYWDTYWDTHPQLEMQGEQQESIEAVAEAKQDAGDPNAITNVQEPGVDEEDFVKVTDEQLFVLRQNHLEVIDRKTLQSVGTMDLGDDFAAESFASERVTSLKMYIDGKVIAIIGQRFAPQAYPYERSLDIYYPEIGHQQAEVKVLFLQTKARGMPEKINEQRFSGDYVDSRMTAHHLYLVMKDRLPLVPGSMEGIIADHPVITVDQKVQGVPCQSLGRQKIRDLDFTLTKVASMNMQKARKKSFVTAMLGGGEHIYMSLKNIYLTKAGYAWKPWVNPELPAQEDPYKILDDALIVSKLALRPERDAVSLEADGLVKGFVRNQFHFKEYPATGVLAVATTSFNAQIRPQQFNGQVLGEGLNHLWILKQDRKQLRVVSGLYHFGKPGEDLRAVRFSGDYAYMVTFKKTDPLYAFNMSNPLAPVLEGELMIPGFSMYLHPVADQRLVGVGYDADDQGDFAWYQGVQISLFDAAKPHELKRLDHKIHGQRGSYSDVTGNHHAFHYDQSTRTFTVPLVELVGKDGETGPEYGSQLKFSGAVAYQLQGDKLQLLGRSSHRDLIPSACLSFLNQGSWWESKVASLDINRLIKLDGRWLSISRFGLKLHDAQRRFQPQKTMAFERNFISCR